MLPSRTISGNPRPARRAGRLEINSVFTSRFAELGLDSPMHFLELRGEVVSGHPDRHVMRVEVNGLPAAFYLKRQHVVRWRERVRDWRAGFGLVSQSAREAEMLRQLDDAGLPCPRWAALGEDERGRAFLMVEEAEGTVDLRQFLNTRKLNARDRSRFATRLGQLLANIHAEGFTTPDFTAKHLLVSRDAATITPIDWASARRVSAIGRKDRIRALAALHASVPDHLATPRDRLRVLRAALTAKVAPRVFRQYALDIETEARRLGQRRSLRDQQREPAKALRLVWLAGEAVCAVPEVARNWPCPADCEPFYGLEPAETAIVLPDAREGHLIRGRSLAPLGRLRAALRGRSWRSPGARLGRLLFHLERHGIPAPRLFAFGQRLVGPASAEWFALHSPPAAPIEELSSDLAKQLGRLMRQLHDAGCRPSGDPLGVFGFKRKVCVREVRAIRLVKCIRERDRATDLNWLMEPIPATMRPAVAIGYDRPKIMSRSR